MASECRLYLLFAGDTGVGKTTLAHRFVSDDDDDTIHPPTLGIQYLPVQLYIKPERLDVRLFCVDVTGDTNFAPYLSSFYRQAHGILLVYDVTRRATFEHLRSRWLPDMERYAPPGCVVRVVGNKVDLVDDKARAVTLEEGRALARDVGAQGFYECSAREWRREVLLTPVEEMAVAMARVYRQRVVASTVPLSLQQGAEPRPNECCHH